MQISQARQRNLVTYSGRFVTDDSLVATLAALHCFTQAVIRLDGTGPVNLLAPRRASSLALFARETDSSDARLARQQPLTEAINGRHNEPGERANEPPIKGRAASAFSVAAILPANLNFALRERPPSSSSSSSS